MFADQPTTRTRGWPATIGLRSLAAVLLGVTAVLLAASMAGAVAATPGGSDVAAPDEAAAAASPHGDAAHAVQQQSDRLVTDCAASSPADHAPPAAGTDGTIGWVDGYWYDEPIDVTANDGLTEAELERLTARTAARVEALRCLTFEERPTVQVVDRETYARETRTEVERRAERVGALKNAQYEAMLLAGPDEDWADVRAAVLAAGVGAYYDPATGEITMVVEEPGEAPVEHVLAHELVHALQDQHHDISTLNASTQSARDAELGLIEGDAALVQHQYRTRCEAFEWSEPCVQPVDRDLPTVDASAGVQLLFQQPYLYGPAYADALRSTDGWPAVDERFERPPTHSSQVIAPGSAPANATLPALDDRSTDEWERVTAAGRPDHEVVGRAALTTMLAAPGYDEPGDDAVVERTAMLDAERGADYDQPQTAGWRGDRLDAYSNGDRVAAVWGLEWASADDARTFAAAYRSLLELRGASRIAEDEAGLLYGAATTTYAFSSESRFDGAVAVSVHGDRVEVVRGPSLEAVSELQASGSRRGDPLAGPGVGIAVVAIAIVLVAIAVGGRIAASG